MQLRHWAYLYMRGPLLPRICVGFLKNVFIYFNRHFCLFLVGPLGKRAWPHLWRKNGRTPSLPPTPEKNVWIHACFIPQILALLVWKGLNTPPTYKAIIMVTTQNKIQASCFHSKIPIKQGHYSLISPPVILVTHKRGSSRLDWILDLF